MVGRYLLPGNVIPPTGGTGQVAAGSKGAALSQTCQIRHIARYGFNSFPFPCDPGYGAQQSPGVGMTWPFNDGFGGTFFHQDAGVHDGDAVAEFGGNSKVVGDQNNAR